MSANVFSPETRPKLDIKRGDIWYIGLPDDEQPTGSVQHSGRPAIIVSNDNCNKYSSVLEVVYLTTRKKKWLPTHVLITSSSKPSIALCEQIDSVTIDKLLRHDGHCTDYEMRHINKALAVSLGISAPYQKY